MIANKIIVISCSNAGSLINFRGKLIEKLLEGNIVFVVTPQIQDVRIREALLEMGVEIRESGLKRNNISVLSDLQYIVELNRLLRVIKPDIFFAYTFKPVVYGVVVASLCKVENIIGMLTGLGYSFTESSNNLLKYITQQALKISLRFNRNSKIIFQNKDDYSELLQKNIITKNTKAFIVNGSGVDLSHYGYSVPDVENINFIMISRLLVSKGVNEYVQAATVLKAKYPDVRFTLAGGYEKGTTDSISEELFKQIQSGGVIDYLGWVTDIRQHLVQSTTVVLPSFYREGIPRSLLEALAIGRPVITTDMIGCKEAVCSEAGRENGFCVPIKNSEALVQKMEFLINNPGQILYLGKNGRTLAEERFDVNKVNNRMMEILASESHIPALS